MGRKEGPESGQKIRLKKAKDTSSPVELKPQSVSQTGAFPAQKGRGRLCEAGAWGRGGDVRSGEG